MVSRLITHSPFWSLPLLLDDKQRKKQAEICEKWGYFPEVTSPEKIGHFCKNDKNNVQRQNTHRFIIL